MEDAYRLEGGRDGLTRQLRAAGQRVVVVGRDGRAWETGEWDRSRTFRSGEQQNLLVADNQTRDYQEASPERRAYLTAVTWTPASG